jgi:hypothetical protein
LLELLGLTGLAVAQPVLDVFGKSPETFVFLGAGTAEILVFTLSVAFLPAVALWGLEVVVGVVAEGSRRWLHLGLVAALTGVIVVEAGREATDAGPGIILAAAVAGGTVVAVLRWYVPPVRTWLRVLGCAPVVFAALFLFASPVSDVAFGSGVDPSDERIARPAPVIMIVLDELPTASLLDEEGKLDTAAFPGFGALARDATWYRNHTTVAQDTPQAVPALLTGRYPTDMTAAPVAEEHAGNLFTLLGGVYDRHVVESFTRLCTGHGCSSAAADDVHSLKQLLKDAVEIWRRIASPRGSTGTVLTHEVGARGTDFEEFIGSLRRSETPRLDYLHVQLPHVPYSYLPSGRQYEQQPHLLAGLENETWIDQTGADLARQRHLLQLRYVDRLLGELVERLRRLGTYDQSLIVVTADHGAAFREGSPRRAVSHDNFPDVIWTPLFIKPPGQSAGTVDDRPVRSIDILPTIADYLDVDLPFDVDGAPVRDRTAHASTRDRKEVRLFRASFDRRPPDVGDFHVFDRAVGFQSLLRRGPDIDRRPPLGPYRYGRHGDLVGVPLQDLAMGPPHPVTTRLYGPEGFENVDRRAPLLPALVTGEVLSGEAVDLAISVNGVIGGWSPPLPTPGGGGLSPRTPSNLGTKSPRRIFQAVVPPSLFRDGRNDVRLFVIEQSAGRVRLAPVAGDHE